MEKITGTICNVPVHDIDITNLLPRTADSTGLVIVKLKHKLEYGGHVLLEVVRPAFLCNILYYLRENNHLYKDIRRSYHFGRYSNQQARYPVR